MKCMKPLALLLLSGGLCYASSLAVYQDKSFYTFTPKHHFIGFSKGIEAKCEGRSVPLSVTPDCPADERLCQQLNDLKTSEQTLKAIQANSKTLARLISLPRPAALDTGELIDSAKRIGEVQARLFMQEGLAREEVQIKEHAFLKQAPTKQALEMRQACKKDTALTLPYGYVTFTTHYEANLQNENEVSVIQYLSVTNKSGIDIEAERAMFYYRSAYQYVAPMHFRPWIVRKYEPIPKRVYSKPLAKKAKRDQLMVAGEADYASAPIVRYEDAREYRIEDLTLPSNGVPMELEVLKWKAAVSCGIQAYPYQNRKAFHVCSFAPKYQIESHEWKVRSAGEVINENAAGEYREGRYNLYTKVEEDIKIERKQIVDKERQSGIFGGTVRKKDGFTLTVTNKSDKPKSLTLIERIPTSTTEEINSKLLSIASEKKVDYTLQKEGKIEMKVALAPYETKVINVLFELSYDKELKVNY